MQHCLGYLGNALSSPEIVGKIKKKNLIEKEEGIMDPDGQKALSNPFRSHIKKPNEMLAGSNRSLVQRTRLTSCSSPGKLTPSTYERSMRCWSTSVLRPSLMGGCHQFEVISLSTTRISIVVGETRKELHMRASF